MERQKWLPLPFPAPSSALSITCATSCVSKSNCAAAGDYASGYNALTLLAKWNGGKWTRQPGKNP